MARYRGPRLKIIRRLGELPALCTKTSNKRNPPGQHGKRSKKPSPYAVRLMEKQKLRYNYGINEKQLSNYLKKARKSARSTTQVLLELLEMRLDNIVFRLGLAKTINQAKQIITHEHIEVNNQPISVPSYQCRLKDRINFRSSEKNQIFQQIQLKQIPNFLHIHESKQYAIITNIVKREDIVLNIDELLVIEYYSNN